jgi:lambda repressor-like predicted transcriptional regulator
MEGPMDKAIPMAVRAALKQRGMSSRALSAKLGYAGNSFVSNVLTGKKCLPLDRAEDWAAALEMRAAEREQFLLACCLELGPPVVQRVLRSLLEREAR